MAGPLANALAIPVVSIVVTPLALLAAVLPVPALLDCAAWLVEWLLQFLEWCAALPGALWEQHVPPFWSVLAALAGVAWLLAPRGVPWRMAGLALVAPAFVLAPTAPAAGAAWITALDVGQGLAVVVRTASRTLLYDAGPAFGAEADSGGRIVVPLLRAAGIARLDAMVAEPRGRRPYRRRADGARDLRGRRAAFLAAGRASAQRARRRAALRRGRRLGVGRRALRVPAPRARARVQEERLAAACCAWRPPEAACC